MTLTYLTSIANADSMGVSNRRIISSVTSSGQFCIKLCIVERAPALPSRVTCQVKESPRAFSESNSFVDLGNEFLHNSSILGSNPRTTGTP